MNILRLKWYGTATIHLEQNGTSLLFDPFLPLSKNVFQPPLEEFIETDGIFVTHDHYDHIFAIPDIVKRSIKQFNIYCTKRTQDILISKGVDNSRICCISPGDTVDLNPFEIRVLKSQHIKFNTGLIIKTLINSRIIQYWRNIRRILDAVENSNAKMETVAFDITVQKKRILLLGSLNLDDSTEYEPGADLLILPFQGRSDISSYSISIVNRLKPMKILLDHFDDTFPPLSSTVDIKPFILLMRKEFPDIPVLNTHASAEWISF